MYVTSPRFWLPHIQYLMKNNVVHRIFHYSSRWFPISLFFSHSPFQILRIIYFIFFITATSSLEVRWDTWHIIFVMFPLEINVLFNSLAKKLSYRYTSNPWPIGMQSNSKRHININFISFSWNCRLHLSKTKLQNH